MPSRASYLLARGLLLSMASRGLERGYHVSNRGQVGSAERRPFKELNHLVALSSTILSLVSAARSAASCFVPRAVATSASPTAGARVSARMPPSPPPGHGKPEGGCLFPQPPPARAPAFAPFPPSLLGALVFGAPPFPPLTPPPHVPSRLPPPTARAAQTP